MEDGFSQIAVIRMVKDDELFCGYFLPIGKREKGPGRHQYEQQTTEPLLPYVLQMVHER
jgi:hypothetical protein